MPHRGFDLTSIYNFEIDKAVGWILSILYRDTEQPGTPLSDKTPTKAQRNDEIRSRFKAGETIAELSAAYGISKQRIHQIVYSKRK
jgi:hypothetical protein